MQKRLMRVGIPRLHDPRLAIRPSFARAIPQQDNEWIMVRARGLQQVCITLKRLPFPADNHSKKSALSRELCLLCLEGRQMAKQSNVPLNGHLRLPGKRKRRFS